MAEMGAGHRRDEMAVAEEEQPPRPPSDITDSVVVHDANGSNLNNIIQDESVETIDEVHVTQHSVSETKVTERKIQGFKLAGASHESQSSGGEEVMKIKNVGVEEDEEEEDESGVQVIEYEYKSGEREIELDLAKFTKHDPYCPSCKHQIIKVVLRHKKTINPVVERGLLLMFIYYCIEYVTVVHTTVTTRFMILIRKIRHLPPQDPPRDINIVPVNPVSDGKKSEEEENKETIQETDDTVPKGDSKEKDPKHYEEKPEPSNKGNISKKKKEPTKKENGEGESQLVIDKEKKSKERKNRKKDKKHAEASDTDTDTESGSDEEEDAWLIRVDKLEILKCIVYGGLIESITSLSVVTSAAATDATTLNIFAIGLALLFSGLIAFASNLMDLKNVNSKKKYHELLGDKKNFKYHAILVILSYVVFGLIAPTTYAFAFRESDNKDWKTVVVLVVALACISLLAIAKAYVMKEKDKVSCYIKTTRYYLVIALGASGISYVVGYMIEMLMLKFGWFKSVQRVTCFVDENANWTSY